MQRRLAGALTVVAALISAVIAGFAGFRQVDNWWGQNCGSVFAPETDAPFGGLDQTFDDAAFSTACPKVIEPLIAQTWTFGIIAVALLIVGVVLLTYIPGPHTSAGGGKTAKPNPTADGTDNLGGQLATLHQLRESGALTEDEFAAAKTKLLSTQG